MILKGHADHGGTSERTRAMEALGVFYVLDQMRMFKSMQAAGGMLPMLDEWYAGRAPREVLMPARIAAELIANVAASRLKQGSGDEHRLDVLVSHDMTLYTIKDQLLGQGSSEFGEVGFLDGVVFYQTGEDLMIESVDADPVKLTLSV